MLAETLFQMLKSAIKHVSSLFEAIANLKNFAWWDGEEGNFFPFFKDKTELLCEVKYFVKDRFCKMRFMCITLLVLLGLLIGYKKPYYAPFSRTIE